MVFRKKELRMLQRRKMRRKIAGMERKLGSYKKCGGNDTEERERDERERNELSIAGYQV